MATFVVWDFSTQGLKSVLQGLAAGAPGVFDIPGVSLLEAEILKGVVVDKIRAAERVIAFVDQPNANVGFEIGLAVAMGKKLRLCCLGAKLPGWAGAAPLGGLHVDLSVKGAALREMGNSDSGFQHLNPASAVPATGGCLYLCPMVSEPGKTYSGAIKKGWGTPQRTSFGLADLDNEFREVAHLVWVLPPYPSNVDVRDGVENAILGIIAGWFCGRVYLHTPGITAREFRERLCVLRDREAREVVDVKGFEIPFDAFDGLRGEVAKITFPGEQPDSFEDEPDERVQKVAELLAGVGPDKKIVRECLAKVLSLRASAGSSEIARGLVAFAIAKGACDLLAWLNMVCGELEHERTPADGEGLLLRELLGHLLPLCPELDQQASALAGQLGGPAEPGGTVVDTGVAEPSSAELLVARHGKLPARFDTRAGGKMAGEAAFVIDQETGIDLDGERAAETFAGSYAKRYGIAETDVARRNKELNKRMRTFLARLRARDRTVQPHYAVGGSTSAKALEKIKNTYPLFRVLKLTGTSSQESEDVEQLLRDVFETTAQWGHPSPPKV